jgi:hypothetical protein
MGLQTAISIQGLDLSIEDKIGIHLRTNLYPPVPLIMVTACVEAIEACQLDESDTIIDLPEGVSYKGCYNAPAWAIVENHRLDGFINYPEDSEW